MVTHIELKIYHIRESNVFHAGEEITGFLECHGPMDIPDAVVKFSFEGYTESQVAIKNRNLRNKAIIFQFATNLFEGPVNIPKDETRQFPFRCTLPVETEPSWSQTKVKYFSKYPDTFHQGPHPLPPSTGLSCNNGSYPWVLDIRYTLWGQIKGKKLERSRDGPVTIVQSQFANNYYLEAAQMEPTIEAESKAIAHTSSKLLQGKADKRRSIGNWFSDKFSKEAPKAVFNIAARTCTVLSPGQGIPISFTLKYDEKASNVPTIPEFRPKQLVYKLKAQTWAIADGTLAPAMLATSSQTLFKREIDFTDMVMKDGIPKEICKLTPQEGGLCYLPFEVAPVTGFKTYNAARGHFVEVKIVFTVGGKDMEAKIQFPDVKLVFNEAWHLKYPEQVPGTTDDMLIQAAESAMHMGATALDIALAVAGP